MGFFENRRIQKEIRELQYELSRVELRLNQLQDRYVDEMTESHDYLSALAELEKYPALKQYKPDRPKSVVTDEYTELAWAKVQIEKEIKNLKDQMK